MRILNKILVAAVLLSAVFFLGSCGSKDDNKVSAAPATMFTATLNLAQEVLPTPTPPAVTPTGSGTVTLDPVTKVLTGSFTTANVASGVVTNGTTYPIAHIHDGNVGVNGPVVVALTQSAPGIWTFPATVLTDPQITRLQAGGYYVNVHTVLNPSGEIRGQLVAAATTSTTAGY